LIADLYSLLSPPDERKTPLKRGTG